PMADGIRLTSGIEFGGLNLKPDFTRIGKLLPHAKKVLPGLGGGALREWMGFRPSLPDSLPVIGTSRHPGIFYAFGHGHLGLTLGPVTGRIMADLIDERNRIDLTPYRADRF